MKAMRFHEYGGPDVLRYEDVEQPTPGAGEVRLRVAATSFNGVDAGIRGGYLQGPFPVTLPHTPGIDVAGRVDAGHRLHAEQVTRSARPSSTSQSATRSSHSCR